MRTWGVISESLLVVQFYKFGREHAFFAAHLRISNTFRFCSEHMPFECSPAHFKMSHRSFCERTCDFDANQSPLGCSGCDHVLGAYLRISKRSFWPRNCLSRRSSQDFQKWSLHKCSEWTQRRVLPSKRSPTLSRPFCCVPIVNVYMCGCGTVCQP